MMFQLLTDACNDLQSLHCDDVSTNNKQRTLTSLLPPCRICGEKASGFHYGANTCEACKGFFRRTLQRNATYTCLKTGHCAILPGRRSCCSACRFTKCLSLGMSKTAIRTGRYTHAKRARDIAEVKRLEKEEQLKQAGILHCTSLEKDQQYETLYVHLADSLASTSLYTEAFFTKLPQREAMYLEKRSLREEVFGKLEPVPRDVYCHIYRATGLDVDGRREMAATVLPIMEHCITRFIQFAKSIPGFKEISHQDQISLLKASRFDCWVLAAHNAVNIEKGLYTNMGGYTMAMDDMTKIDDKQFVLVFFKLAGQIQKLHLSQAENALLQGISMMSTDRCSLYDPQRIQEYQMRLVDVLQCYLKKHHPDDPLRFAKMLQILTELRQGDVTNCRLERMVLNNTDITFPPLVLEMWYS